MTFLESVWIPGDMDISQAFPDKVQLINPKSIKAMDEGGPKKNISVRTLNHFAV